MWRLVKWVCEIDGRNGNSLVLPSSWHLNICANQGAFCLGRLVSTKNKDLDYVHTFLHMKYNFMQNSCFTSELLQGFGCV